MLSYANQTVVFQMSLENASRICHLLKAHGIVASTAEALVGKGITTLQRDLVGNMGSQPVIILDRQLRAPTLIWVGWGSRLARRAELVSLGR